MGVRRGATGVCTAERLEELFSTTRSERLHAAARKPASNLKIVSENSRQPLPFPAPPASDPFLERQKRKPYPLSSPSASQLQDDGLRRYRIGSDGEDVETSVVSFLVVFIACTGLLFWLIGQFAHILLGMVH